MSSSSVGYQEAGLLRGAEALSSVGILSKVRFVVCYRRDGVGDSNM